jgi:hypothetical protein
MTKQHLKQLLIKVRNGAFITPILFEIWQEIETGTTGIQTKQTGANNGKTRTTLHRKRPSK